MAKEAEVSSQNHSASGASPKVNGASNGLVHANEISNGVSALTVRDTSTDVNTNGGMKSSHSSSEYASFGVKTNILHERTVQTAVMIRTQLGSSADVIFDSTSTFHDFLEALGTERLRHMPHDGSIWDKVLRWTEGFTGHVHMFQLAVEGFMNNSVEASQLIWGSCLSLLQIGPSQVHMLNKAFSTFHRLSLTMYFFLRQPNLHVAPLQVKRELAYAFSDLMELTCTVNAHYCRNMSVRNHFDASDFDSRFGGLMASFNSHKDRIANAMWSSEAERFDDSNEEIDMVAIRRFLQPQDRIVKRVMSLRESSGHSRAEFTCEWFSRPLATFLRNKNKLLLVTGKPACGKTVLSSWIIEHLQGSLEQDPYSVLYYHADKNIKSTCSTMNAIKGLLVQAVDRYIGRSDVLEKLQSAMNLTSKGRSDKAERELWAALEAALSTSKTIIIVDGVDHITSESSKKLEFLERLQNLSSRVENAIVKAIALSQPLTTAAPPSTQHYSIEQEHITQDIYRFILSSISSWQPFHDMAQDEKKGIAKIVSDKSKGSFLWADLAFATVRQEQSLLAIKQAVERLPASIEGLINIHISTLSSKKIDSKSLLAWILASERPLLVSEIKAMLEIDPIGCKYVPRYSRIKDDILEQCGSLITIREGVVHLRHASIRQHFDSDKSIREYSFSSKETHYELALRCLAFVKARILIDAEPTYECMEIQAVHNLFDQYELLEYCAAYWTTHFRLSTLYADDGKHQLSAQFKACFPNSNILAYVEGSSFQWQFGATKTKSLRLLAYTTRKMLFGQRSVSALQSLMHVVRICQSLDLEGERDREKERKELWAFSFEAWNLSTSIADVSVALTCAKIFIQSLTIKFTERTVIATQKEEVLKFIIEKYKHSHGASHIRTIKYTRILAELYVSIHELEKAAVLYREIYETTVEKYDYFHEETSHMYEILLKQLKSLAKFDTILEIVRKYHEHVILTLSITDERRWKSTLALAKIYEERHETMKTEEILLSFWRSVSKTKITGASILQAKVEATLKYSQFLTRYERKEESLVILRGLWSEIEIHQEHFHSKSFFKKVQMVAEEFKSLKELSFARSVYSSLWSCYEKHEERTSTEAIEIATCLAETITEIVSISSASKTTSETTILTIEEERTLREVFQSTLTQSTTTISSSAMKVSVALATSYAKQERWSEAVEVYSETISKAWSSIETSTEVKELTIEHHSEVVEVAMSLASCRFEMLQIEKAEFIYQNLFRSMIRMSTCAQWFFSRILNKAIEFYEKTYRFEKAIAIYKESFVYLGAKLGKSHEYTIEVLRAYGSLSKRLEMWSEVEQAYQHIFNAYKDKDGCCDARGIELAFELCATFERKERWDQARTIYICLWQTFVKRGKEYSLKQHTVELLYEKYTYILEHKTKADYSTIRNLAVEYRNTCTSFYGSQSEITVRATMQLAQIYEKSVEYHKESMSLYEEVLKSTTSMSSTTTSTTSITKHTSETVKTRLAKLYSSSTTTVTKAISLYTEQYETCKIERGYSSKETLAVLRDLVTVYKKQESKETKEKTTLILKESVTEIFQSEKHSEATVEAAKTIARLYVECGYRETALSIIQEFRQKIVEQVKVSKKTTVERFSSAFLAAFAEIVTQVSFSTFMAEIRTEVLLFESYFRAMHTQKHILTILERGAQLRIFLLESRRDAESKKISEEMLEVFSKYITVSHSALGTIVETFFSICLEEILGDRADSTIIECASTTILNYMNASKFQQAYDLTTLVVRFIHLEGGYHKKHFVLQGFNLALYLSGRRTKHHCKETKLHGSMMELAKIILGEAIAGARKLNMSYVDLDSTLVNDLTILLGDQGNYVDLELILSELWSSRATRKNWGNDVVFAIGKLLIETRFTRGLHDEAIQLCIDIRYNLKRVYTELDSTTLEFSKLLSELYTARGQYAMAATVQEEILVSLLEEVKTLQDGSITTSEGTKLALTHIELLRRALHRPNGKPNEQAFKNLFEELQLCFGKETLWAEKPPQPFTAASSKGNDQLGTWHRPANWAFLGQVTMKKRDSLLILKRGSYVSSNGGTGSSRGRLSNGEGSVVCKLPRSPQLAVQIS